MGQVLFIGIAVLHAICPAWLTATKEVFVPTKISPSKAVRYGCMPGMLAFQSMFDVSGAGPAEKRVNDSSP
jgi:hypothetical protein